MRSLSSLLFLLLSSLSDRMKKYQIRSSVLPRPCRSPLLFFLLLLLLHKVRFTNNHACLIIFKSISSIFIPPYFDQRHWWLRIVKSRQKISIKLISRFIINSLSLIFMSFIFLVEWKKSKLFKIFHNKH